MFKRLLISIVILLSISGCSNSIEDTEIRMAQMRNMASVAEHAITAYDERIEEAEAAISEIKTILADPNLAIPAREELHAVITKAEVAKAKFETAKVIASQKIADIKARITELESDGIQPGEDLIAFGEGISDVGRSLPAPVGPIFLLLGAIIGGLGEARKRKATALAMGIAESIDAGLSTLGNEDKDIFKARIASDQSLGGIRGQVWKLRHS